MTEVHLGTAFGSIGALDTIVRRCMEGFAFWQRIINFSESFETFKTRLDLLRARLAFWAQEWGIETNQHLKDRKFRQYATIVANYLELIRRITEDLGSLGTSPTLSTGRDFVSMNALLRLCRLQNPAPPEYDGSEGPNTASSRCTFSLEGFKWALQDGRSEESLKQLATLIQDLHDFLPPPHHDAAGVILLGSSLAGQDSKTLARASLVMDSAPLQAGLAWLKSIAYRNQAGSYSMDVGTQKLDASKIVPLNRCPNELRFMATYEGSLVFVEQKCSTVSRKYEDQRVVLNARIENIVQRLQDPRKPAELRTLPCQGVAVNNHPCDDAFETIYSVVYKADTPRFFSLRDILSQKSKSKQEIQQVHDCLSLGRRFLLAQILCHAVMYLHLADWLHKAIRSENILFFAESMADLGSSLPYLIGFEYSRPDTHGEQTEHVPDKKEYEFYRHPRAQTVPVADSRQPLGGAGRYSKVYDIYSIGVILVELGLMVSVRSIVAGYLGPKANPNSSDIRQVLVEKTIPKLRFTMGEIYAHAACICLDGFFDKFDRGDLDNAFYINVVRQIGLCNA